MNRRMPEPCEPPKHESGQNADQSVKTNFQKTKIWSYNFWIKVLCVFFEAFSILWLNPIESSYYSIWPCNCDTRIYSCVYRIAVLQ